MSKYIATKSYAIDADEICFDCEEIYIDSFRAQGFETNVAIRLCPKHRPTKYSKEQFFKDWQAVIRKEIQKWTRYK